MSHRKLKWIAGAALVLAASAGAANTKGAPDRITREVRHELAMLPYYGVFGNLAYRVDGCTVTRIGEVTRPTLKSNAEIAVKTIEGVRARSSTISKCCLFHRWTT